MKNFNLLFLSILGLGLELSTSALARAENGVDCGALGCTIGDYNLGGTVGGSMIQITQPNSDSSTTTLSGLMGIMANGEFTALGQARSRNGEELTISDYAFFDSRLITLITPGVQQVDGDKVRATFSLRLIGSISGGFMVYRAVPINLGLEDGQFKADGNGTSGTALLGTSIVLPISLIAKMNEMGMDSSNLYISVTAGMRINSAIGQNLMGFQPKVRFMNDRVSVEARYLYAFGPNTTEQKGSLIAAFNHLFKKGDQLGVIGSYDQVDSLLGTQKISELLIFYGGNL